MTAQSKENNLSAEVRKNLHVIKKPTTVRPNIDHLVKKIIIERRKENKKNLLVSVLVLLVIGAVVYLSLNY